MKTMNIDSILRSLESEAQIEKSASATDAAKPAVSEQLAGILEKKASEDLTKQAFEQGEALARELLSKVANEIITADASMVADDDKKVTTNETAGDVESVLQSTVDKAIASGATTENRVDHETKVNNVEPAGGTVGETQPSEEESMNKSAQEDKSLAKLILEKLAQEFNADVTTDAAAVSVAAAPAPNKIQVDNAQMTAQDDAKVQGVVPEGDGTVNALFETIVNKAKAQGGQSFDLINGADHVEQRGDGGPGTDAGDAVEKAAAVSALVAEGLDFDTAVDLVKQAEEALDIEAWEQEKQACLTQLMDNGVDFDNAVALIKEAEQDLAKEAGLSAADQKKVDAGKAAFKTGMGKAVANVKDSASSVAAGVKGRNMGAVKKGLAGLGKSHLVRGAAGAAALAGGAAMAAHKAHEKKACVDALMAEGINFETAVELTKQASVEVYGE